MDGTKFDGLAQRLAKATTTRGGAVKFLAAAALGVFAVAKGGAEDAEATDGFYFTCNRNTFYCSDSGAYGLCGPDSNCRGRCCRGYNANRVCVRAQYVSGNCVFAA